MIQQFNPLFPMKKKVNTLHNKINDCLTSDSLKNGLVNLVLATSTFKPAYRSAKLGANLQVGQVC